MNIVILTQLR